jgi:hypothetical protein
LETIISPNERKKLGSFSSRCMASWWVSVDQQVPTHRNAGLSIDSGVELSEKAVVSLDMLRRVAYRTSSIAMGLPMLDDSRKKLGPTSAAVVIASERTVKC